jgi:hypothetical protein
MADKVETTLNKWMAKASDDIDLRTEDGILQAARDYAVRRNVSYDDALTYIRDKVARAKSTSRRGVVAAF